MKRLVIPAVGGPGLLLEEDQDPHVDGISKPVTIAGKDPALQGEGDLGLHRGGPVPLQREPGPARLIETRIPRAPELLVCLVMGIRQQFKRNPMVLMRGQCQKNLGCLKKVTFPLCGLKAQLVKAVQPPHLIPPLHINLALLFQQS